MQSKTTLLTLLLITLTGLASAQIVFDDSSKVEFDTGLDLTGQSITGYYNGACASGEFVTDIQEDGTLVCEEAIGGGSSTSGLPEILEQNNTANQSLRFENGAGLRNIEDLQFEQSEIFTFGANSNNLVLRGDGSDTSIELQVKESADEIRFWSPSDFRTILLAKDNGSVRIPSGNLSMEDNNINGLADPEKPQDAATKSYVESYADTNDNVISDDQNLGTDGNQIVLDNGGSVTAPYAGNSDLLDGNQPSELNWGNLGIDESDISALNVGLGNVRNVDLNNAAGRSLSYDTNNDQFNINEGSVLSSGNDLDSNGDVSSLSDVSTSDLTEGTNLYFSDERALDAIGTAITGDGATTVTYDDSGNTITVSSTDTDTNTQLDDTGASSDVDMNSNTLNNADVQATEGLQVPTGADAW